jgi:hypothetical protein
VSLPCIVIVLLRQEDAAAIWGADATALRNTHCAVNCSTGIAMRKIDDSLPDLTYFTQYWKQLPSSRWEQRQYDASSVGWKFARLFVSHSIEGVGRKHWCVSLRISYSQLQLFFPATMRDDEPIFYEN